MIAHETASGHEADVEDRVTASLPTSGGMHTQTT